MENQILNIKASDSTRFGQRDCWKPVKSFMEKKGIGLDVVMVRYFVKIKERVKFSTTFSSKKQL